VVSKAEWRSSRVQDLDIKKDIKWWEPDRHVGTSTMAGADRIKLAKTALGPAETSFHSDPLVDYVDGKVHLDKSSHQAVAEWQSAARSSGTCG
jgi:hypothetical protein